MVINLRQGNNVFKRKKSNYVDKSDIIERVNAAIESDSPFLCVSMPRRFGKTTTANMLRAYYDCSCDSHELFADLKAACCPSFERHLNKYEVLFIDFSSYDLSTVQPENIVKEVQNRIRKDLKETYPDCNFTSSDLLIEMLYSIVSKTGVQFYCIIDEWDKILCDDNIPEFTKQEYLSLLQSLFKTSLSLVAFAGAYITGILPVRKYMSLTATTDFVEYSILSPGLLYPYFGFTESEVIEICKDSCLDYKEVKEWYDGYIIGNAHMYNPYSIRCALRDQYCSCKWGLTTSYEMLERYIFMNFDGLKQTVLDLLLDIPAPVDSDLYQNTIQKIQGKDDVLTTLVHLGYLSYRRDTSTVRIPNKEIKAVFYKTILRGKSEEVFKQIQMSENLIQLTIKGDEETVAKSIQDAHNARCSSLEYNNEHTLRSVILLAYYAAITDYITIQELPSGTGYADILFLPKRNTDKPALLLELKWNHSAKAAIAQIKDRNYPQVLQGFGGTLLLVGINYSKKTKKHTCKIQRFKI